MGEFDRSIRRLLWLTNGRAPKSSWLTAAKAEAPVSGRPKACKECPLRKGGEWDEGASAAVATMSTKERSVMRERWGCHATDRPCAGMSRITKVAEVTHA